MPENESILCPIHHGPSHACPKDCPHIVAHIAEQSRSVEAPASVKFLCTKEFLETLPNTGWYNRTSVIGRALEYCVAHPDGFNFLSAVKELAAANIDHSHEVAQIILRSIIKKLDLKNVDLRESKRAVYEYVKKHIWDNGFYFHGFNGAFAAEIQEHGLSSTKREWDWTELEELAELTRDPRYGRSANTAFGLAEVNSKNVISVASTAEAVYRYASGSPEWFGIFCEGENFSNRNYQGARQAVERRADRLMQEQVIDESKKKRLLDFFETLWHKFAPGKPKAALIKRNRLLPTEYIPPQLAGTFDDYMAYKQKQHDRNKGRSPLSFLHPAIDSVSLEEMFEELYREATSETNSQYTVEISPQDFAIIDLPDPAKVYG